MDTIKNFEDLKVGDKVIYTRHFGGRFVLPITKITKNQIICDDLKFSKKDGYNIPKDKWVNNKIYIPKEGEIEEVQNELLIKRVIKLLNNLKEEDITIEQAKKIKEILINNN